MPNQPPLTPVRYEPNFFSIDISSIGLRDQIQSMEHPIFSLSKKPDMRTRHYTDQNGNRLTVRPLAMGVPTIWDKDLLVFAISKIVDARNRGEDAGPTIRFHIADVIEFGQMTKSSTTYRRLDNALLRLAGCTLETNIRTGNEETTDIFHIIDRATIKRQYNRADGRLEYVEFTLSDWLWRAIEAREVLTLHPDYFRLRQALARRIYEIARKHCGRKAEWQISLDLLREKSGSKMNSRKFRHEIRKLAATGDLLDYDMQLAAGRSSEIVRFKLRKDSKLSKTRDPAGIQLSESALRQAAEIIGTAGNLSAAEVGFRAWVQKKRIVVRQPDSLFLTFCERWVQQLGSPPADDNKPSFRDKLALEWWRGLAEAEREAHSQAIGIRIEIDGIQYIRDELALARRAFDNRYPLQFGDPEAVEFPPVLLERLAGEIEPRGVTTTALAIAWRTYVQADTILSKIEDPAMSLWLFAQDVAKGKPAALQAVQAASAPPAESRQKRVDSWQLAYQSRSEFEAWKNRAAAWWKTLPEAKRVEAVAAHAPGPELISAIETNYIDVDSEQLTAVRAYAVTDPPPRNRAGGFAGVKEAMFQASWFSDKDFCEFHDIDFWDDRFPEFLPGTWEERVQQWWWEGLDWEGQHTAMSAHWNDKPVRAAREAGASKEEVADLVASRAYHRAFPEDSPPPGHPHLA